MNTSPTDLHPPHEVTALPHPEGGWKVIIQWGYGYRHQEILRFVIERKRREDDTWAVIADKVSNDERSYLDVLPDENEYTYRVSAIPGDGGGPLTAAAETPWTGAVGRRGLAGEGAMSYLAASPDTAKPTGIRKPIRSLRSALYVVWDIHPEASGYLLEAVDVDGTTVSQAVVSDPDTPVGLLVGLSEHPVITARVSILRPGPDGTMYAASSATRTLCLDAASHPHLSAVEFDYDTDTGFSRGAVLALDGGGRGAPSVYVNGTKQAAAWSPIKSGGFACLVAYVTQGRAGVTATLPAPPVSSGPGPEPASAPS